MIVGWKQKMPLTETNVFVHLFSFLLLVSTDVNQSNRMEMKTNLAVENQKDVPSPVLKVATCSSTTFRKSLATRN